MVWLWILLVTISGFLYAVFFGAPYVPSFGRDIEHLLDLSELKIGDVLVDLGSGDGKVLVAAAKRGINVVGYEINPILWMISIWRLRGYKVQKHVYLRSMWWADLDRADGIFLFLGDRWMSKMAAYLKQHARPKTEVISYVFQFKELKQIHKTRNAAIYRV